ncbi:EAL domain-containing protein [Paraglaciecola marina]|uniref:EAL domain-containing protein n=1 Tax=Paraglaciecola marina TaxID=2500157 RepID=UPI00105FCDEC|nr:EAL domain-containing protein [Paraglaciecola marina]
MSLGLFKKSIATKLILYVGSAITIVLLLQAYININRFEQLVTPLIVRDLDNALARSQMVFESLSEQIIEDAQVITSHNALSNYIDYELLDDTKGMNEELVTLEQFLISLNASKSHYLNIEIFTKRRSIIRINNGEVAESTYSVTPRFIFIDKAKFDSYYTTSINHNVLYTLKYKFSMSGTFAEEGVVGAIYIVRDASSVLQELVEELQGLNMQLTVMAGNVLIAGDPIDRDWLSRELHDPDSNLTISVGISEENAFLFVHEMHRSIIVLAISLILVLGISQFFTITQVIAKPLKSLIDFMNKQALGKVPASIRYQTERTDEIGLFAQGLNNMLEQIHTRQTALSVSEERLALALWGSGEGMWEFSVSDSTILLVEESCEILSIEMSPIKLSLAEFISKIHEDDRANVNAYFKDFKMEASDLFEIEFRVFVSDNLKWLKMKGRVTKQGDELSNDNLIVGTLMDISDQREAEKEIRLYAKAFDSSASAIVILDKTLVVLAVNEAFKETTGSNLSDVVGRIPDFIINHSHSSFDIKEFTHEIQNNGKWQNELIGMKKNGERFIKDISINAILDTNGAPTHYVCAFNDITHKKKSEKDLWTMANHDILTGLPNRGYFRKSLDSAIVKAKNEGESLALFFIDLDRFKQVNDTLGHESGDQLLRKVGATLVKLARKTDYAARLGGDEFAIIIENVANKVNVERIAMDLVKQFDKGLIVNDKDSGVGVSIGISLYPENAKTADELVHYADTAMYFSKTTGSNLFHFFEPSMSDHVNRRNLVEKELREALKEDKLSLYFQPQISITTGVVVSFEALSRWFHPTLGTISPDEFIPIAEDAGLIVDLGKQVLKKACQQVKQWHEHGFSTIKIAINVSIKQFMLSDVTYDLSNILNQVNLDARYIELELTESLFVDEAETVINTLKKLKQLGVSLSIDDFGTGYSSLSYLNKFPLDVLKIDKSFVNQLSSDKTGMAITQSIVAIAHALDLEIVAEGVETEEQLSILDKMGCHYVQGYLYGPPISSEESFDFLEHSNLFEHP